MTESNDPKQHWKSLADLLGAEPADTESDAEEEALEPELAADAGGEASTPEETVEPEPASCEASESLAEQEASEFASDETAPA